MFRMNLDYEVGVMFISDNENPLFLGSSLIFSFEGQDCSVLWFP